MALVQAQLPEKVAQVDSTKIFSSTRHAHLDFLGRNSTRTKNLRLIYATDTNITRFLKTKSEATAYDTKWDSYFIQRDEKRMTRNFDGRKKLSELYKQQNGICPKCAQRLTIESEYKTCRNSDNQEILIHKNCSLKPQRASSVKTELISA